MIGLFTIRSFLVLAIFAFIQIGIAFFYDLITPIGVIALLLFWALCALHFRYPSTNTIANFFRISILVIIALLFSSHLIPGFHNLKVFDAIHVSPHSSAYTMYLNMDKTLAAIILVISSKILEKKMTRIHFKSLIITLGLALSCVFVLMPLALQTGFVAFDPKFPDIFWFWAANNLLFVCFSEEVVFRGTIQHHLAQFFERKKRSPQLAILISSVLFGIGLLGHMLGGLTLMLFTMIAGVFYGYAYYLTNRLEAAICVHFILNTCHFLLFTYPMTMH